MTNRRSCSITYQLLMQEIEINIEIHEHLPDTHPRPQQHTFVFLFIQSFLELSISFA